MKTTGARSLPFRWRYIIAPLVIFLISLILTAVFYPQLSPEVATHFELDGTPDGWLSRELTVVWSVVPQLVFALAATAIIWIATRLSSRFNTDASTWLKPSTVLVFMGNMVALPQVILLFAMLDIFSYNALQSHIMPIWLFAVIILALAAIALVVLLAIAILKSRQHQFPAKE